MLFSVIAMAAALAAAEPAAQAPAPATTAAAPAAKPEKPKKVCVEQQQMGSLFTKRICATPEEWEKRRLRDQEEMSKANDRTACGVNC